MRTHEPEGLLAPLAWIEVEEAHPEVADVRRGRTPTGPPRRIGPAFVPRLAPVVAERLARHETPREVASDVAALHRVAHGVGLAAKGRLPEAPLLAAEGAVLGDSRARADFAVTPRPGLFERHSAPRQGRIEQLTRQRLGDHRLAPMVERQDDVVVGQRRQDYAHSGRVRDLRGGHPLSVTTAAGGALLASGRPRGRAATRTFTQFAVPSPSPTELRAVRRLIGPEARRITEDARLHPRTPAPVVATQRDVSTLRELRVNRIERYDAGGIMRPTPPGTVDAHVNTTNRNEYVTNAPPIPAHATLPTHPVMTAPVVNIDARLNVGSISKAELRDVQRLLDSRVKPIEDAVVAGFRKLGS